MIKLEDLLKEELSRLENELSSTVSDPEYKKAISRMAGDMAMLPIRLARGEDIAMIASSLKAEAAMRGVALMSRVQHRVEKVWKNLITKILLTALTAAI